MNIRWKNCVFLPAAVCSRGWRMYRRRCPARRRRGYLLTCLLGFEREWWDCSIHPCNRAMSKRRAQGCVILRHGRPWPPTATWLPVLRSFLCNHPSIVTLKCSWQKNRLQVRCSQKERGRRGGGAARQQGGRRRARCRCNNHPSHRPH